MKLKIGYFPPPSEKNSYTIRMKNLLSKFGVVTPLSPKRINNLIFSKKKFDVIVFNWLENRCFSKKGELKLASLFISFLWFKFMRIFSDKLVYVRHNIYPHNVESARNRSYSIRIMNYFEKNSDYTIVHSPVACNENSVYIPHPLYDIKVCSSNNEEGIGRYFVCFGRIEKYKKLHSLIENWPQDLKLVIAGSSDDKDYILELKSLIKNKDIEIIDRFLSDEDAYELVKNAYYSILPSNSESMIVSGSFFFSISAGTPVIAVTSDFYKSLNNRDKNLILIDDIGQVGELLSKLELNKTKLCASFIEQFNDETINKSLKKIIE